MIKVLLVGLGPIGLQAARYIVERNGVEIAAGVDIDPEKAGKSIGEISDIEAGSAKIYNSVASAMEAVQPDVAVLTTVSKLRQIEPQITAIAEHQLDIVSTCEELTWPWQTQPQIARRIDETCKKHGVCCLATGVNPGFLMDYLPSVLSSVCQNVEHIKVARIQDAAPRRGPFHRKIGVGLTPKEFDRNRASIAHVGLPESVGMIAGAVGWSLDEIEEVIHPVIADREINCGSTVVKPGFNRGVEQIATGYRDGKEVIKLTFRAAAGESDPHDTISIKGEPSFASTIGGGINGDVATAAITINAIRTTGAMEPGLRTMLDIPVLGYFY